MGALELFMSLLPSRPPNCRQYKQVTTLNTIPIRSADIIAELQARAHKKFGAVGVLTFASFSSGIENSSSMPRWTNDMTIVMKTHMSLATVRLTMGMEKVAAEAMDIAARLMQKATVFSVDARKKSTKPGKVVGNMLSTSDMLGFIEQSFASAW